MALVAKYYPSTGWWQKWALDPFFAIAEVGHAEPATLRLVFESSPEYAAIHDYEIIRPKEPLCAPVVVGDNQK